MSNSFTNNVKMESTDQVTENVFYRFESKDSDIYVVKCSLDSNGVEHVISSINFKDSEFYQPPSETEGHTLPCSPNFISDGDSNLNDDVVEMYEDGIYEFVNSNFGEDDDVVELYDQPNPSAKTKSGTKLFQHQNPHQYEYQNQIYKEINQYSDLHNIIYFKR